VLGGEPLADDFHTCTRAAEIGMGGLAAESMSQLGAVRPARFVELFVISSLCQRVPFGIVILVPLVLTILTGYQVLMLLRDLGLAAPWPGVGAALWFLQPLGTEAALWPSALHVPLGLAFALIALRLYRRGANGRAALASVGAYLSVEQVIFALPLACWMVCPRGRRWKAVAVAGLLAVVVIIAYAQGSPNNPRAALSLADRWAAAVTDLEWFIRFPAIGLGLHSMPLAVLWAFPLSIVALLVGGWVGARWAPALSPSAAAFRPRRRAIIRWTVRVLLLIALVNLPLIVTLPHDDSPRTFTPTWLCLTALVPVAGARVLWTRKRVLGAVAGLFVVGALLSLALSVSVRLKSAEFTRSSSHFLAAQVSEGGVVAVCGVRRTVTSPAPAGSFSLHQLIYEWAAEDALTYYTGRRAEIRRAGLELGDSRCPNLSGTDVVVTFDRLLEAAGESSR
jgi:hypothetical protein